MSSSEKDLDNFLGHLHAQSLASQLLLHRLIYKPGHIGLTHSYRLCLISHRHQPNSGFVGKLVWRTYSPKANEHSHRTTPYLTIEDDINLVAIEQGFKIYPHWFSFSVMPFECAVPRKTPSCHHPWSFWSIYVSQVTFKPNILISCRRNRQFTKLETHFNAIST